MSTSAIKLSQISPIHSQDGEADKNYVLISEAVF